MQNLIDAVFGGLKIIGWLVAIGLVCGIPLFIFNSIKGKWPRVGKVIFAVVVFAVAAWLFYGSALSFIDAKTTKSGAYVTSESGEEWWASKSLLKRQGICSGIGRFLLGCGIVWVCWQGLNMKEKRNSAGGSNIEDE